jgi:hypothetical protein
MIEYVRNWLAQIEQSYSVNPLIFGAIYCIGVIPFWLSLYKIAQGLKTRNFKQVQVFGVVLGIVICAPFTYVAIWGRNLPIWFWIVAGIVIAYSVYSTVRKIRKTSSTSPRS